MDVLKMLCDFLLVVSEYYAKCRNFRRIRQNGTHNNRPTRWLLAA